MEIILGKTAGFCFGVSNAISKTEEQVQQNKEVYCIGELVHNKIVTENLKKQGVKFIDNIDEAKKNVIVRAHGISKEIYEKANELKINLIDLTCPKVLKIHELVGEYSKKGYFVFFIGQADHAETIGTISFCEKNNFIIEEKEDVNKAIEKLRNSKINKLLIISQTTFSIDKFEQIVEDIKKNLNAQIKLEVKKAICNATQIRQSETDKISKEVDFMIIIGGKHSSNTKKLYEISQKNCTSILVEDEKELLNVKPIKSLNSIGIMAGASTPRESIEKCIEIITRIW